MENILINTIYNINILLVRKVTRIRNQNNQSNKFKFKFSGLANPVDDFDWFTAYLDDNQKADTRTEVRRITVHSSHDVHHSLTNGYYHAEYYGNIETLDKYNLKQYWVSQLMGKLVLHAVLTEDWNDFGST